MFRSYFFILLITVLILGQFLSWRLFLRSFDSKVYKRIVTIVFVVMNIGWGFTLWCIFTGDLMTGNLWTFLGRPIISWQFVHLLVIIPASLLAFLIYQVVRGSLWLLRRWKAKEKVKVEKETAGEENIKPILARRDFVKTCGGVGLFGILGLAGYGILRQTAPPDTKSHTLRIPNLPRSLDGFSIAHISDIHLGLWSNQRELALAVEEVSRHKPDMVIFTGDLVDHNPHLASKYQQPIATFLSKVPYGVYGILGNHDHHNDPWLITKILNDSGMRMLREERVNIEGLPLSLTGLDDQGYHQSWLKRRKVVNEEGNKLLTFDLIKGPALREEDFKILLNHRPEGFRQAAVEEGYGLYLAGHTHGGQYALPGYTDINLARMIYKYNNGLYNEYGSFLNVSCGIAAVGIPFRFGPWPEFSMITLKRA
ncbi:MAG: metallophosphoesterase [Deltaproteobacteria bacterium]|nr:metallophosphoesterase [Deltaproteobacteria bacterium]